MPALPMTGIRVLEVLELLIAPPTDVASFIASEPQCCTFDRWRSIRPDGLSRVVCGHIHGNV